MQISYSVFLYTTSFFDFMKNKCLFLDRDGVINRERGSYTFQPEDFFINEGIVELSQKMKNTGFLIIVITNQGGINRGIYSFQEVEVLHNLMQNTFKNGGAEIDDIYMCPHHQEFSNCLCRKPKTLLLEKAIAKYNINVKESFFIGDSERDIKAASESGICGIKITPNNIHEAYLFLQQKRIF